jgi:hypothetical protein
MTADVLHRCVAGGGCSSKSVEDGKQVAAATAKPSALCEGCVRSLERVVGELPEMWVALELALGDKHSGTDEHVSGTKNPPIPISVATAAVMDSLVEWVSAGAARVAELLNTADPSPGSRTTAEHGRAVVDGCRLLRTNLYKLLDSEADAVSVWLSPKETGRPGETWTDSLGTRRGVKLVDMTGVEMALEIQRQHKLARMILGHTQPRLRQTLACPLCAAVTCYRTVRTIRGKVFDDVECETCSKQWTYDGFQRMCGVALEYLADEKEEHAKAWLEAERLWLAAA